MRVLVCGDRHWTDARKVWARMSTLPSDTTVVEGDCSGADRLGAACATRLGIPVEAYPADWQRYGRAAGPVRNQQMLDTGIDLVLAFHSNLAASKGTADMVRRARLAGVMVEVVT